MSSVLQHGNTRATSQGKEMSQGKAHDPGPFRKREYLCSSVQGPRKDPSMLGAKLGPLENIRQGSSYLTGSLISVLSGMLFFFFFTCDWDSVPLILETVRWMNASPPWWREWCVLLMRSTEKERQSNCPLKALFVHQHYLVGLFPLHIF